MFIYSAMVKNKQIYFVLILYIFRSGPLGSIIQMHTKPLYQVVGKAIVHTQLLFTDLHVGPKLYDLCQGQERGVGLGTELGSP